MRPEVQRLTPRGPGGVALISCSGAGASRAVSAAFVRARGQGLPDVGRLALGHILDAEGALVDEVLLVRVAAEGFEVGCHGGPAVTERVRAALVASCAGCSRADDLGERRPPARPSPADLTCDDRVQAEARAALPLITTELGCQVLLRQLGGALSREAARLEAQLKADAARPEPRSVAQALASLRALLATARLGAALFKPPEVAFVGSPNAGKSSLMNALLGKERVLVSPGAGTTRDAVADAAILDGVPAVFVDTAGQGEAADDLEAAGIERARRVADSASLRLIVLDASSLTEAALTLLRATPPPKVVVLNKIDLLDAAARGAVAACVEGGHAASASTGEGLVALRAALRVALVGEAPGAGPVLFTPRQAALAQGALRAVERQDLARAARCLAALRGC